MAAQFNGVLIPWCAFGLCVKNVVCVVFTTCLHFTVKKAAEDEAPANFC